MDLFSAAGLVDAAVPEIAPKRGRKKAGIADEALKARREATSLDRVHAAMLLQAGGRANALRSLLKSETERSPDFLRLANALSALYPKRARRSGFWTPCYWRRPDDEAGQAFRSRSFSR